MAKTELTSQDKSAKNGASSSETAQTDRSEGSENTSAAQARHRKRHLAELSRHWRRFFLIGLASLLAIVLIIIGFFYSQNANLMRISIANISSGRQIDESSVINQLDNINRQYKISIQQPAGEIKSFGLGDAGIQVDSAATVKKARQARHDAAMPERLFFWKTQSSELVLKVERIKLAEFINNNATLTNSPPKNASLVINKGELAINGEEEGEGYSVLNAEQAIINSIKSQQSKPHVLTASKLRPLITAKDLAPSKSKAESILEQKVTLTIGENVFQPTRQDIGEWIELTPVESDKTVDVTVNSGKVALYINSIIKKQTRPAKAQVVTLNSDGSTAVLIPGQNGMDINKKNEVAAEIASKIATPSSVNVDLPVTHQPFKTINAQAYDKWLAIDVTTKRMYAYEKTNLARSFLISAGAPGTPTVLGQYSIRTKVAKQDMRGRNTDGSRYFQADVRWVNYFYQDYAIHGNHWRPTSYFGNINSSHGCVGIQNPEAEWLYNWAPVGTPVIVYD